LRDRLERDGTPRFDMLVITLLTGATGFLVSVVSMLTLNSPPLRS
jgi:hypothetical protein